MAIPRKRAGAKFSSFRLVTDGVISRLVVDGVDMSHALSVTYSHREDGFPVLTVVLPVEKAEISGVAAIETENGPTGASGRATRTIGDLRLRK